MTTVKKIAYNTIYQLVGKVVSMLITVLVTIVVARYFGRSSYGEFSLMQAWPALFFIIVDFGFNAIAVKEISENWDEAGKYFSTILYLRVLFSFFLIILLGLVLFLFPYSTYVKLGISLSLFLILTQGLYATGNIIFQVKLRYDLSTYAYLAGYAVILLLTFLCVRYNLGVIPVSVSYVAGGLITFLCMLVFIKKTYPDLKFKVDKKVAKSLISKSLPLGLMFLFSQISFKSDSILMSVLPMPQKYGLDNNNSLALYALPYKIFEVALVVPTFFMNSMYPVFLEKMKISKEHLLEIFWKSINALVLVALLGAVSGIILAPYIINLLGGSEFAISVSVLRILMAGLLFYFLTQPLSWLIVTLGHQKELPKIYAVSALFNVSMNYFFIPKYSFYASSFITHASEFLIFVMLAFTVRKIWHK